MQVNVVLVFKLRVIRRKVLHCLEVNLNLSWQTYLGMNYHQPLDVFLCFGHASQSHCLSHSRCSSYQDWLQCYHCLSRQRMPTASAGCLSTLESGHLVVVWSFNNLLHIMFLCFPWQQSSVCQPINLLEQRHILPTTPLEQPTPTLPPVSASDNFCPVNV